MPLTHSHINATVDLLEPGHSANPTDPADDLYALNVQGTRGECFVIGTAEQIRAFGELVQIAVGAAI